MSNNPELKYCVNCKHYRPHTNGKAYCQSPNLDHVDLVTGLTKKHLISCYDLRCGNCGWCDRVGQWFEADVTN
jgi:hypothetical protein